uniref:Uncharacterized protein n=1 Tax=Anguilla anguilla TaxID=7936 RepID=A0A0E9VXE3_ANGAN
MKRAGLHPSAILQKHFVICLFWENKRASS